MDRQSEIARRIQFLQAELQSLGQLISLHEASAQPAVAAADPEAVPADELGAGSRRRRRRGPRKERWSYRPGTWYRIVGDNPFTQGNNLLYFDRLKERYGEAPFSREQLAELYNELCKGGTIDTTQSEESYNLVFLRTAGQTRDAIKMVAKPGDDLPPEAN